MKPINVDELSEFQRLVLTKWGKFSPRVKQNFFSQLANKHGESNLIITIKNPTDRRFDAILYTYGNDLVFVINGFHRHYDYIGSSKGNRDFRREIDSAFSDLDRALSSQTFVTTYSKFGRIYRDEISTRSKQGNEEPLLNGNVAIYYPLLALMFFVPAKKEVRDISF